MAAAVLARGKTTAVSEAYLAAICDGYANADYLGSASTLRSGEVAMLPTRLSRVLEVGHTSGADGLFGFARYILLFYVMPVGTQLIGKGHMAHWLKYKKKKVGH